MTPDELTALLAALPLAPLGPGRPEPAQRVLLARVTPVTLGMPDGPDFRACLSGLWLAFDFLDEAHAICQDLDTPEGSYWHAILHRREPDYPNAKYWFRQVGEHPIYREIARSAPVLGYPVCGAWDPCAFVDACAAHRDREDQMEWYLRCVQEMEWHTLFGYCKGGTCAAR